ncbi:histone deacetylase family protein [Aliishimia ponticola]|uniref:Histone deacetylase family protein n=1 Tax=Aliishimia ponticola TaxID=2499833 RepID=A0A4S4N6S5_9RHOB|nr:histone deacetylase family protein [Aliishimia ponticola]THH34759.1 histone deacetylase family protein [Aliishimia ponticola]
MTTALITHPDCLGHENPPGAPEKVARLEHLLSALVPLDLLRLEAPMGTPEQAELVHDAEYVAQIPDRIPTKDHIWLDGDTYLSPGSLNAIYRGVGGAVRAVDAVLDGEAKNAFCATRPPGHHAEQALPMGFCIFGNVAIAAKHALENRGLKRVAVLDFDVHHGNGTQALLQDDPRAFFVSSHQFPLWPGTGRASEIGPHGNIMNIPLDPASGGAEMQNAWEPVWDRLYEQKPEMILISAGFDAHTNDPLAELRWEVEDFAWLTAKICEMAAELSEGRVVSVLEGGYDLRALAMSAKAHVEELMKAAT